MIKIPSTTFLRHIRSLFHTRQVDLCSVHADEMAQLLLENPQLVISLDQHADVKGLNSCD